MVVRRILFGRSGSDVARTPAPRAGYRPECRLLARALAYVTRRPRVLVAFWQACRVVGRAWRWLTSGWRRPLLWIAAIALAGLIVDRWVVSISWLSLLSLLALAVVAAFVVAVWRARDRIVIEPFLDYTSSDAQKGGDPGASPMQAPGMNDALVSHLASLRDLFRNVEERGAIGVATGAGRPVEATLQLEDVTEFLRDASTGDAKVSLGPLVLPIGFVMAMLGRLARGARVTGALQSASGVDSDGKPVAHVVLTAYYTSRDRLASWSVREDLPATTESLSRTEAVTAMVEELAARMFADLALSGTTSWRASRRFLQGLSLYSLAKESRRDRVLKLRRAERCLVEALAEDEALPLARYNLGVVYRDLRADAHRDDVANLSSAAEIAFRRELQRGDASWEPYYALAQTYFEQNRHPEVSPLCDRVVEVARAPARQATAYDLKSLAERNLTTIAPELAVRRSIDSGRRAVGLALLALARAELGSRDPSAMRKLAAHCLLNLGLGVADGGPPGVGSRSRKRTFRSCRELVGFASRLSDSFSARFELGKIALESDRPDVAVHELRAALRIDPTSALGWAWLAKADARMSSRLASTDPVRAGEWGELVQQAQQFTFKFLNIDAPDVHDTTNALAEALDEIGSTAEAQRVRVLQFVRYRVPATVDALEQELAGEMDPWTRGQIETRLGFEYRDAGDHAASESHFREAIDTLADFDEEIRRNGLAGEVAVALMSQGNHQEALREARAAIALDPMNYWERQVLGDVQWAIADFEGAAEAYEDALSWLPNSPSIHTRLANCYRRLAGAAIKPGTRTEMYERAIGHLEAALTLHSQSDLAQRVLTHYSLGQIYTARDEYDRAIPHFRNALADSDAAPVVQVLLGQAYVRMKRYDAAEEMLSQALATATTAADDDPNQDLGERIAEEWRAGELAATARRFLALSFLERDVRLGDARRHVAESDRLLDLLGDYAAASDRASGRELEGRIHLAEGRHDDGIASLSASVALWPDVEAYLHLAQAYNAKAESSRTKAERRRALEGARAACRHARDIDVTDMFLGDIDRLSSQLDASPAVATP